MNMTWKIMIWVAILCGIVLGFLALQYKWVSQNDRNQDGKADEWMRFTLTGDRLEFKKDKNFDGVVDYIEHYKNDNLTSIEVDFNYNGFFETTGRYDLTTEVMVLLERDTNEDGKTDRRTIFDTKTGSPLRVEVDTDNDGTFDQTLAE